MDNILTKTCEFCAKQIPNSEVVEYTSRGCNANEDQTIFACRECLENRNITLIECPECGFEYPDYEVVERPKLNGKYCFTCYQNKVILEDKV